jgi:hypothetical protein
MAEQIEVRVVEIVHLPWCALCLVRRAEVDGKTKFGPWAFMCGECHEEVGMGLGVGLGQRLVPEVPDVQPATQGGERGDG